MIMIAVRVTRSMLHDKEMIWHRSEDSISVTIT